MAAASTRPTTNTATCGSPARFLHDRETLVQAIDRTRRRLLGADAAAHGRRHAWCWSTAASFRPSGATRGRARGSDAGRRVHRHRPAAHDRARRRLPAPQRSGRRPLVLARRAGHRRGARPGRASRPTSSMPMRRAAPARRATRWPGRRPDGRSPSPTTTWSTRSPGIALALMVAGAAWLRGARRARSAAAHDEMRS